MRDLISTIAFYSAKHSLKLLSIKILFPSIIRESKKMFLRSESICSYSASTELPNIYLEMLCSIRNNIRN